MNERTAWSLTHYDNIPCTYLVSHPNTNRYNIYICGILSVRGRGESTLYTGLMGRKHIKKGRDYV